MGKIIVWIVVVFAILFVLRLVNVAKNRREAATRRPSPKSGDASAAMVQCAECGVYLPRADARALPNGFACGDACAQRRDEKR